MKCFYHSADLDGHCSGAIVKLAHPECEMIPINYGQEFPWDTIILGETVFMVDFSLPAGDMKALNLNSDLRWIDHHKSAIEALSGLYKGIREIGLGACELVWRYCFPNDPVPYAVHLLSVYDVWRFEYTPDTDPHDIWVPVENFPNYCVSQNGCVKSISHLSRHTQKHHAQKIKGKIIKLQKAPNGYLWAPLHNEDGTCNKQIQNLVVDHFLEKPSSFFDEANHIDGDKQNNHISNLEWSNRVLNSYHAVSTGLKPSKSKYYGVRELNDRQKYSARVSVDGKRHFIGNYNTELEAAVAYDSFVNKEKLCGHPRYYPLNLEPFDVPERRFKRKFLHADVLPFQYGIRIEETQPGTRLWTQLLTGNSDVIITKILDQGLTVLKYQDQSNTMYAAGAAFETELNGHRCLAQNKMYTNSQSFDSVFEPDEHAIMLLFGWRHSTWTCSLYSLEGGPDVSKIAVQYGGGGHARAAGFSCDELPFDLR